MIEWEVLDNEPIPQESTEQRPPRKPLPWKWIVAITLLAVLVVGSGVAWRYRVAQQQLKEDIEQIVVREERAVRLGIGEQASTFADPDASVAWKAWYRSTYAPSELPLPTPMIEDIEQDDGTVLVTVRYALADEVWRNVRSYRLVNNEWRRTPIPAALWQRVAPEETPFFTLEMSKLEAVLVPPEALAQTLTIFREAWREAWPLDNHQPLTVTFSPDETLTEPQFTNQHITIRSPLLNPSPGFDPPTACSLGLITALAQTYSGELNTTGEEEYLRITMRQAVVNDIIENTDGLCQVVDSAILPPDVLGVPPAFADYLIYIGGRSAPKEFIDTFVITGNPYYGMLQAAPQIIDYQLLLYAARRSEMQGHPLPITSGTLTGTGIGYGTIVRSIDKRDSTLDVRSTTGVINTLSLDSVLQSAFAAPDMTCLTEGNKIAFTYGEGEKVEDVRLLDRVLETIDVPALPATTRLIYQRNTADGTEVYARTAEGNSVQLVRVPGGTQIYPNAVTMDFAFLTQDACGWIVNHFDGQSATLKRWALPTVTPRRLLWVLNSPMAVVQATDSQNNDYWQLYTVGENVTAANVGTLVGFRPFPHSYLMQYDHALQWTVPTVYPGDLPTVRVVGDIEPIPYRFTANTEFSALSVDGRWLTYTVYPSDGRSDLNVLDLYAQQQRYLTTIPPSSAGGQSQWTTQVTPTYGVIIGALGETRDSGMSVLRYTMLPDDKGAEAQMYRATGEIDNLQWCRDGTTLTFRETTALGSRIVAWNGDQNSVLTDFDEADKVLWCP